MSNPPPFRSRHFMVFVSLGLAALLGGCGYFNPGPNVIHVGSGLQWDASQLGRPDPSAQTGAPSLPSAQPVNPVSGTNQGG